MVWISAAITGGLKREAAMHLQFFKQGIMTFTVGLLVWLTGCDQQSPPLLPAPGPVSTGGQAAVDSTRADVNVGEPLQLPDLGIIQPLAEECCTQPGDASECWMSDAEIDGVLCSGDGDCPSGSCNVAKGRCRCSDDDDCNDGVCKNSVCGPSWCNGYRVCSCWGGCEWWSQDENQTLHDLAATQDLYCCEGVYAEDPIEIDPALGGYFTPAP